jgi:lipopolysaccharide transport system ATP-binding protein
MNDVIIRAEGLGKKYLIGHQISSEGYVALRDVLARQARSFLRSAQDMARGRQLVGGDEIEEYWALKDVSFDIRRGDVVGIIGPNGAGKSTLLKILSRIAEPSAGWVKIKGRVASLLEVGTGFHPELSGRENIYLNGAILGMRRAEINRKFDEIVAFAGVEKFLDTPVKRYSSGMYVRLAFAVAAHLEPEILVVDEVLAVGDAEFQKKCLGKMHSVAGQGRTVLFVSHNMSAIKSLCKRGFYIQGGTLQSFNEANDAIFAYRSSQEVSGNKFERAEVPRGRAFIKEASIEELAWNEDLQKTLLRLALKIISNDELNLNIDIRIKDDNREAIAIASAGGFHAFPTPIRIERGETRLSMDIDITKFATGKYFLSADLTLPWIEYIDRCEDCLTFEKEDHHWTYTDRPLKQNYQIGILLLDMKVKF